MNYNAIGAILDQAAQRKIPTPQISNSEQYTLDEAYAIQSINVAKRYERGSSRAGLKMGFTSKAKMEQMGVHDVIWGKLTSDMAYTSGSTLLVNDFIHPRAEPEIAFKLNQDISSQISLADIHSVIDSVAIAIEIIDSRYEQFKFSLEDVIADNCSSAGFVIGYWMNNVDVRNLNMSMSFDGKVVQSGNSNAILDNPYQSLVDAIRLSLMHGESLTKGLVILAGAATPANYIKDVTTITATADNLGTVSLNIA